MYGGLSWSCFMDTQKHKECYCTCLSVAMMLTFNFVRFESVPSAFWLLPSIRMARTQCKSLVFIICKNPPASAAFVIPSLSPHLCPSLTSLPSSPFFLFLPFLLPVKCFVCHDFPCSLSERRQCASPVGTGPQFPRQLYNCFGCVPSATGYRGIIDVKRNMYETRTCERPPYGSVRSLTRGHLSVFQ